MASHGPSIVASRSFSLRCLWARVSPLILEVENRFEREMISLKRGSAVMPSSRQATANGWSTPGAPPVDDDQVRAVPREETVDDLLCEVVASPVAVACD